MNIGKKKHDLKLVETVRRQQSKGEKNPVKAVFKKQHMKAASEKQSKTAKQKSS